MERERPVAVARVLGEGGCASRRSPAEARVFGGAGRASRRSLAEARGFGGAGRASRRSLVEARLAACVQIQSVQSVYRWKDKVCSEPEYVLAIKTTAARYAELEQFIRANHSYETPEIVRVEIAGGSREYLGWIGENVERG